VGVCSVCLRDVLKTKTSPFRRDIRRGEGGHALGHFYIANFLDVTPCEDNVDFFERSTSGLGVAEKIKERQL